MLLKWCPSGWSLRQGREENHRKSMFSALEVIHNLKIIGASFVVTIKTTHGHLTLYQNAGKTTYQLELYQKC